MTQALGDFTYQNTGEDEPFGFDFTTTLGAGDSVASVTKWGAIDVNGVDPDPESHFGAQSLVGNLAARYFGPPVIGAKYAISCLIHSTNGADKLLWAFLDTEAIGC